MKKRLSFILFLIACFIAPVYANNNCNSETLSVLTSAVKTFTAASIVDTTKHQQIADVAYCSVSVGAINFTMDGTTPTTGSTGVGHPIAVGQTFSVTGIAYIRAVQMIAQSTTATVYCTYSFDRE